MISFATCDFSLLGKLKWPHSFLALSCHRCSADEVDAVGIINCTTESTSCVAGDHLCFAKIKCKEGRTQ